VRGCDRRLWPQLKGVTEPVELVPIAWS
jgi:hypothetical protein